MYCHRCYRHNLLQENYSKDLKKSPLMAFSDVNQSVLLLDTICKVLGFEYKQLIFYRNFIRIQKKFNFYGLPRVWFFFSVFHDALYTSNHVVRQQMSLK